MSWRIVCADVLDGLRQLEPASVQTVVTSPPYWGLRDYGDAGQIGLEPTPEQYVERMVEVFREVRRVLRDDGTVWLNLGDSYATQNPVGRRDADGGKFGDVTLDGSFTLKSRARPSGGLKPKDLVGIPWRVAFALQADGWYLRSDIIWSKPNPMPESVTDRPTKAHEYVFLLSKSSRYYFDADAVREPHETPINPAYLRHHTQRPNNGAVGAAGVGHYNMGFGEGGRNIRTVWNIATEPFPGAHFATFPKRLVEPCVKAGTSERGCCAECGAPFVRLQVRRTARGEVEVPASQRFAEIDGEPVSGDNRFDVGVRASWNGVLSERRTTGWVPGCTDHEAGIVPCAVLDPFCGSGTTGVVALRLGRDFVGVELNPQYAQMARERISDDAPLFNVGTEIA